MKVLLVHNEYGKVSGEEVVVRSLRQLLEEHGHNTPTYFRSSAEIMGSALGAAKAFFCGMYSIPARSAMRRRLLGERPDVVHVHNLFPLISPSILGACHRAGVPVVMTVHNYRLVCPNGLHLSRGQVCERCIGGREYHCVLNRCEGGLLKSAGYALRNALARKLEFFHRHVTLFTALTEFQRRRLIDAGFCADRITVLPNMVSSDDDDNHDDHDDGTTVGGQPLGEWVGYIGRVSPEKGMPALLAAAAALPHVPFKIAGAYDRMPELLDSAAPNVQFVGHLGPGELDEFYRRSRIIVLCSTCFEGFPTILVEAMRHGKPVVCSRIGGLPEIVDDRGTGLLFTPGDGAELAAQVHALWDQPARCREMGAAGRAKASRCYSRAGYYDRLMDVYRRAAALGAGGAGSPRRRRRHGSSSLADSR
jgi:glycosyltransferase involved in cell wall biosynthesis